MGNLAKAAIITAKLNGLTLAIAGLLGLITVVLAVLSVKVDNEVAVVHLWPTGPTLVPSPNNERRTVTDTHPDIPLEEDPVWRIGRKKKPLPKHTW
jgi:hypothetical protein